MSEDDATAVTLDELDTWDGERVWRHISAAAERALARARAERDAAVLSSPDGGAEKTGADD